MKKIVFVGLLALGALNTPAIQADSAFSGVYYYFNRNLKEPVNINIDSLNRHVQYQDVTTQQNSAYALYRILLRAQEKLEKEAKELAKQQGTPVEPIPVKVFITNKDRTKSFQVTLPLSIKLRKQIIETAEELFGQ